MEIDKDWQTRRRYMKTIEDKDSDIEEDFMNEITKIKQGINFK